MEQAHGTSAVEDAYFAGIVDGEGTISLSITNSKKYKKRYSRRKEAVRWSEHIRHGAKNGIYSKTICAKLVFYILKLTRGVVGTHTKPNLTNFLSLAGKYA